MDRHWTRAELWTEIETAVDTASFLLAHVSPGGPLDEPPTTDPAVRVDSLRADAPPPKSAGGPRARIWPSLVTCAVSDHVSDYFGTPDGSRFAAWRFARYFLGMRLAMLSGSASPLHQ